MIYGLNVLVIHFETQLQSESSQRNYILATWKLRYSDETYKLLEKV